MVIVQQKTLMAIELSFFPRIYETEVHSRV